MTKYLQDQALSLDLKGEDSSCHYIGEPNNAYFSVSHPRWLLANFRCHTHREWKLQLLHCSTTSKLAFKFIFILQDDWLLGQQSFVKVAALQTWIFFVRLSSDGLFDRIIFCRSQLAGQVGFTRTQSSAHWDSRIYYIRSTTIRCIYLWCWIVFCSHSSLPKVNGVDKASTSNDKNSNNSKIRWSIIYQDDI